MSTTAFGWLWHALDHELAIRHSPVAEDGSFDMSRYNVLIHPGGGRPREGLVPRTRDWVRNGGTLILIGGIPPEFLADSAELTQVRPLEEVLDKLDSYELTVLREWLSREDHAHDTVSIWSPRVPTDLSYPWPALKTGRPEKEELKRRDKHLESVDPRELGEIISKSQPR